MQSTDVIHSFWAPNLNGKKDLVPGYTSRLVVQADTPGVFRGQCAEFCGFQHAKMGLVIVADPPTQYTAWLNCQRGAARPPGDSVQAHGQEIFLSHTCAVCHAINGTPASATLAPDLTHIGSRLTLAAGALPNTPAALSAWIDDPRSVKPGTLMPPAGLDPRDVGALVAYLEHLK
jgi:cytochrome c oxidase subunit 2